MIDSSRTFLCKGRRGRQAPVIAYTKCVNRNIGSREYVCLRPNGYRGQSGGRGQYGHVWLKFEPAEDSGAEGLEFVNEIAGGVVPREYIPAVAKGIEEQMQNGVLAGYPLLGIKATLYDGSYHEVDSSEMAFKIAGSMAFKEAARKAGTLATVVVDTTGAVTSYRARAAGAPAR